MHDSPRIADLIEAINDGTVDRLAATTLNRCWPGGPADRTEPAALEWVRRWSPRPGAEPGLAFSHN